MIHLIWMKEDCLTKYKFTEGEWIETIDDDGIYIDGFLKKKLDSIKTIIKKKYDAVILIDGKERTGKSTLGMICGHYLSDTKLGIINFASGMQDASDKIMNLPDESILMVDEGSLVFNSKDVMMKEQKQLMKILDVVGQKNMIFIVILPSFFSLNKDIATRRSKFLLHVYTDEKLNRGRYSFFGEKKKRLLYNLGKKSYGSYAKPKANFIGRFYKFEPSFYKEYLELKKKSLMEALKGKEDKFMTRINKVLALRNKAIYLLHRELKWSHRKIAKELNNIGEMVGETTINDILDKIKAEIDKPIIEVPILSQP
jgi:glycosyltransferase involved in cell wall biosynthesis